MNVKLTPWQRRTAYGLFAVLAFLFALRATLPTEAVRERLIMAAADQGWQLAVEEIHPTGLVGVRLENVTLESHEGLTIPIARLDVTLRLLSLLQGRQSIAFDAELSGGHVEGFTEGDDSEHHIVAAISGLELAHMPYLRKATGIDFGGVAHGALEFTLDEKRPAKSTGHLDFKVEHAALNGGEMPVPGMSANLTLPKVVLGQFIVKAEIKDGKFNFTRLESKGEDLELRSENLYVVMQQRMAQAPLSGKVRAKINDALWRKPGTSGFKPLVEMALASARGGDGSYGFQLFGSLSQPRARMQAN